MWWELLESKWSGQNSEITQEWLEEDRLPFQILFSDSSHNFKMRIYESTAALKEQNRAKGTKHFNEAKTSC